MMMMIRYMRYYCNFCGLWKCEAFFTITSVLYFVKGHFCSYKMIKNQIYLVARDVRF